MNYPKFLSIGNWLFIHIGVDNFDTHPVGGPIPNNLYIANPSYSGIDLNLSKNLRTYEGLIEYGCTEPSKEELMRLLS